MQWSAKFIRVKGSSVYTKRIIQALAGVFVWAVSTTDLKVAMTSSGWSARKIAVPATITLLPKQTSPYQLRLVGNYDVPAWAQASIVLGVTPPSTSMSLSGKRARSSATLGIQRSISFCPPRPGDVPFGCVGRRW